ncbi:MAG: hypothetical protein ABW196_08700 [Solirubrobacterales bacterium]
MAGQVYTAKEGFATEAEGRMRVVAEGETFASGHPVVKAHPGAFAVAAPANEAPKAKPKRKRRKSSGR